MYIQVKSQPPKSTSPKSSSASSGPDWVGLFVFRPVSCLRLTPCCGWQCCHVQWQCFLSFELFARPLHQIHLHALQLLLFGTNTIANTNKVGSHVPFSGIRNFVPRGAGAAKRTRGGGLNPDPPAMQSQNHQQYHY